MDKTTYDKYTELLKKPTKELVKLDKHQFNLKQRLHLYKLSNSMKLMQRRNICKTNTNQMLKNIKFIGQDKNKPITEWKENQDYVNEHKSEYYYVIVKGEEKNLVKDYHISTGHAGRDSVLHKLRSDKYYWHGMFV